MDARTPPALARPRPAGRCNLTIAGRLCPVPDTLLWIAAGSLALLLALVVLVIFVLARLRALGVTGDASIHQGSAAVADLALLKVLGQALERDLKQDFANGRREQAESAQGLRGEVGERLHRFTEATQQQLFAAAEAQAAHTRAADGRLVLLTQSTELRLDAMRTTLEQRLDVLRDENAKKLDEMRATVDEKLQQTLQTRLDASFKLVSDRLEKVHTGLGEMQNLAQGVGDLKRVLGNVKSRGTWGEMQLGALLADMLTPHQFGINVETVPGSNRRVEFAIRMPTGADEPPCWIPVDSKFPVEEWERLQQALDRADAEGAEASRRSLAQFMRLQAKKVRDSYVCPPHTSDFAFLFVPTESLYAELMARPGLSEGLQREFRVTLAGPSNFLAFLNIVQMGFQRASIEQRSAEAWRLLGAVRTEFGRFGEVLTRAQRKLQEASNTIDEARGKTTTIARKLRDVQTLPEPEAARLLSSGSMIDLAPDSEAPPEEK